MYLESIEHRWLTSNMKKTKPGKPKLKRTSRRKNAGAEKYALATL